MRTLRTELDIAEAIAARELGDRERAEPALEQLAGRSAYPCTYVQVLASSSWSRCGWTSATSRPPRSLFHQAEELVSDELAGPGRSRPGWPGSGVLVSLAEDDLAAAEHWSGQVDDPLLGTDLRRQGPPRRGATARRRRGASSARSRAARGTRSCADCCWRAPSPTSTARPPPSRVEVAVERAAEHGMLQTVAAEGGAVLDLVELAAWRAPSAWMDRLRRARARPGRRPRRPGLVEELTSRERDVLRLLPSRLTLREIASELFVSQNTLKFHLRVIYRKLGVNSRAEAVESGAAAAAAGPGLGSRRSPEDLAPPARSNSSADSTPRSTRCSSARTWSTRRTARAAAGPTGTASSTGRRRSRST